MGHKIHPRGFRTGVTSKWRSRWFGGKDYAAHALEDKKIRRFLEGKLVNAGLDAIEIERSGEKLKIIVHVSKPGIVIGRGGSGIDLLRQTLEEMTKLKRENLEVDIQEVRAPSLSAKILAARIARGLERRAHFRRITNEVADEAMGRGAKGVRIVLSGRIAGAEIARSQKLERGSVPLSTLRARVDFARITAHTRYGTIGVKVWVYLGEEEEEEV
jgi:small subunit ribosomal protein S3